MSDIPERLSSALADRYRIERELGEGGMATVYLAQDLKHDRKVAIKVLKSDLAAVIGAERFLSEIRTTANLQHPHILPLYDSGQADGILFYVMPYVQGESLREYIDREKQLPVDTAVELTRKIAEALDYAHEQGVVHRDIKPANILLSERGEPLVADFGIALAVSQAGAGRVTETGLSLGTPHYMSPEQATGDRDLDPRSDVYALGCVLFEMLVGQAPFAAPSAQAVLARILTDKPDPVTKYRHTVPAHVEAVIETALERLPADRFPSARAFSAALTNPVFRGTGAHATQRMAAVEGPWRARFMVAAALAGVAVIAAAGLALRPAPESPLPDPVRFNVPVEANLYPGGISISQDGRQMIVGSIGDFRSRLRSLDGVEMETLPGNLVGGRFIPGRNALVGAVSTSELQVISLDGGASVELPSVDDYEGWAPGDNGRIYIGVSPVGPEGHIISVPVTGGTPDTVFTKAGTASLNPQIVLPGSRLLLYSTQSNAPEGRGDALFALDLETGEDQLLFYGEFNAGEVHWMEEGYILYTDGPTVFVRRFDPETRELLSEPQTVTRVESGDAVIGYGGGVMALGSTVGVVAGIRLQVLNEQGVQRPLPEVGEGRLSTPDVSPDGRRIALTYQPNGDDPNIWTLELPDGPLSRVSLDGGDRAQWAPDGRHIYFMRDGDLYWRVRDGTAPAELILDLPDEITRVAPTASGDSLFLQVAGAGGWDLYLHVPGADPETTPFLADDFSEGHPAVSPDGRWLAYYSSESGQIEIYVRSLGANPRRVQVSRRGGGAYPRWSSDGRTLFFFEDPRQTPGEGQIPLIRRATLDLSGPEPRTLAVDSLFPVLDQTFSVFPGDSLFAIATAPIITQVSGTEDLLLTINFDAFVQRLMEPEAAAR